MSQSPLAPEGDARSYEDGWIAVNKLMRRGWSWSGHERNCAFVNLGAGRFADASTALGLDFQEDGRALATVDWDLDGDLDLVTTARTGPRLRILENRLPRGDGFLSIRLVGTVSNPDGVGALVQVDLQGGPVPRLVAERRAGEGFLAQSSAWLHFGLGAGTVRGVAVVWPGGRREEFAGCARGGWFVLREGSGRARRFEPPAGLFPGGWRTGEPPAPPEVGAGRVVLATPVGVPTLSLVTLDGRPGALFGIRGNTPLGVGAPVLLSLWATWCAPCRAELKELARRADVWRERGLVISAVSVDAPEDRDLARGTLRELGWTLNAGYATPEAIELLDALQSGLLDTEKRLPLPASFLIGPDGRLAVLYLGPVDPDQLEADLELFSLSPEERRARAVPFAGRWHSPPPDERDSLAVLERVARDRGLVTAARELHLAQLEVLPTSEVEVHYKFGRMRVQQGRYADALEHFDRVVELDPYHFGARFDRARTLHLMGRLEEAREGYLDALRVAPGQVDALYGLGRCQVALGDRSGALESAAALEEAQDPRAGDLRRQAEALPAR